MGERGDIETIIADIDRKAKERAERIPDTQAALRLMFDCCERLKELGWRDMMYAPKDIMSRRAGHYVGINRDLRGAMDGYVVVRRRRRRPLA